MTTKLLAFIPLALAAASGCIIHDDRDPPPPPFGDLAFDWSFDGIPTCDEALVDEVDVAIFDGSGALFLENEREPCEGGGLIFTDMPTGIYQVFIDAYDRNGDVLYSGSFEIAVQGGELNDAGVVVLDSVGAPPPPPPALGELAFFWTFAYEDREAETSTTFDCELAGVDEVDVTVTPLGNAGAEYDDTFACSAEGVLISNLPEGRYEVVVQGYGEYHEDAILLFDGAVTVDVLSDSLTDLEDLVIERAPDTFSDFDVAWDFVDASCESADLDSVTLSIQRFGQEFPEFTFTSDCTASSVIAPTFVPGSYDVSVAGTSGGGTVYLGTSIVDLPPDAVATVDLVLAPVP